MINNRVVATLRKDTGDEIAVAMKARDRDLTRGELDLFQKNIHTRFGKVDKEDVLYYTYRYTINGVDYNSKLSSLQEVFDEVEHTLRVENNRVLPVE